MKRTIRDAGLTTWEVFATTADGGVPTPARIVFHSLGGGRPAVAQEIDGDVSDAEALVAAETDAELTARLAEAVPLR